MTERDELSGMTVASDAHERAVATTLLIILPEKVGGQSRVPPLITLLGLPLLYRAVMAATRAGFGRILVVTPDGAAARPLLAGTSATILSPGQPIEPLPFTRLVLLAPNVLPDAKWLETLGIMPIEPERLYRDGASVAVIEAADSRALLSDVSAGLPASKLFDAWEAVYKSLPLPVRGEHRFLLTVPEDARRAEDWLLRGLVKDTESFMSRHVERRLSLAITRRLVSTPITPNVMTVISIGVGLLGAAFFLSSSPRYQLTGALLFLAHSILDGCDGELARLKFQESRRGGLLDFWGDNVVHVAVFLCIAAGWSRAVDAAWPLLLGAVAVLSALGSAWVVYHHTMRGRAVSGPLFTSVIRAPKSGLSRFMDVVARRDFIYLVVGLSAFGKAAGFLVLAAVGTPLFLFVLLWLTHIAPLQRGCHE